VIITIAKWATIRDLFSEEEKLALNSAITGETVCPRGIVVDEKRLSLKILGKIAKGSETPKA
jgi:hypothetical protein